ncbi:hypothetical protein F4604DRAFT_1930414 [Suillus subluteus]|nr:hypothetical protein F4604DRAFT_1930414 [Suillus subluteus]
MFIHLTLVNNDTTGGPFNLAYQFLAPYFPHGGISYQDLMFDIATEEKVTAYQQKVDKLVWDLQKQRQWSRVVIGITNHMDNVTRDPFAGYNGEKYITGAVDEFLAILLKPWQVLIDCTNKSYLWFFACGALVNNANSFVTLQKSLQLHHVSESITFTAVHFRPGFTSHLLFAFMEQVLIKHFPIHNTFPHMLSQSNKLGCHTDIVLTMRDSCGTGLKVIKYAWTHIDNHPWGQYLLIQCPDCGLIDAW